jgi:pilus assembly protein CpaC
MLPFETEFVMNSGIINLYLVFKILKEGLMKNKKVLYILTVLFILIFSSISLAAIPVDVTVGKETILNLKEPSKRVSIANPDIAGIVLISPSEIIINGKKSGITSLIIWDKEGKPTFFDLVVYKERLVEFEREKIDALTDRIKSFAPDSDVRAEFAGDTLVLTGTVQNRLILDKIEKLAMLYATKGCTGISRGCSLPTGCKAAAEEVKPGQGFVSVNVAQQAMQEAMQPAGGALCVLNLITMPEAQQVILEVKVAQIDKTKLKQLGINFLAKEKNYEITAPGFFTSPDGNVGGGTGSVTPGIGSFDLSMISPQIGVAHFPSGVAAVLQALQEKGLSKILAEPNLIVRSGEEGNFLVGKRIPVQTVYGVGTMATPYITYEDVGIKINFGPEVLETGAIRLKINPAEVSSVARYVVFQGIIAPEIDTRTVNTSVDLREGESLILAGLLSQEMKDNIQKIPILGDIPILGAFFRSTRKELEENELAFFITPRLIKPMAPGVKPKLPTDNRPTPEEEKEFEWIPVP